MQHKMPVTAEDLLELCRNPSDVELVAIAITGIVKIFHDQGYSLESLINQVMTEDPFLDKEQRRCLKDLLEKTWNSIPL